MTICWSKMAGNDVITKCIMTFGEAHSGPHSGPYLTVTESELFLEP